MSRRRLEVEAGSGGSRLDLFVGEALGLSRARLKALFEEGAVRVDGRVAKKGHTLVPGQVVEVDAPAAQEPAAPVPQPELPLQVLREDPAALFLDKPSGWPTHPLEPGERGTLANALVARYPECASASLDPREGGVCHRLDTLTSGVVVAARTREAWLAARALFSEQKVDKRYLALVDGPLADGGEITVPLRHRGDRVEPSLGEEGRPARTTFEVLARAGAWSLVRARIDTGVLHQVRAHLAAIGAPIAGDAQYGGAALPGLERFFLHAESLRLPHPLHPGELEAHSPLPEALRAVLEALGLWVTPPSP